MDTIKYAGMTVAACLAGCAAIVFFPDISKKVLDKLDKKELHKPIT